MCFQQEEYLLGIMTERAYHPGMAMQIERLNSFDNFFSDSSKTKEQFAEAGFFFTGRFMVFKKCLLMSRCLISICAVVFLFIYGKKVRRSHVHVHLRALLIWPPGLVLTVSFHIVCLVNQYGIVFG